MIEFESVTRYTAILSIFFKAATSSFSSLGFRFCFFVILFVLVHKKSNSTGIVQDVLALPSS